MNRNNFACYISCEKHVQRSNAGVGVGSTARSNRCLNCSVDAYFKRIRKINTLTTCAVHVKHNFVQQRRRLGQKSSPVTLPIVATRTDSRDRSSGVPATSFMEYFEKENKTAQRLSGDDDCFREKAPGSDTNNRVAAHG